MRPEIVDRKERIGDFEMDTIVGSKHKGAILSIVDCKTKSVRLALMPKTTSEVTKDATIKLLSPIKQHVHFRSASVVPFQEKRSSPKFVVTFGLDIGGHYRPTN